MAQDSNTAVLVFECAIWCFCSDGFQCHVAGSVGHSFRMVRGDPRSLTLVSSVASGGTCAGPSVASDPGNTIGSREVRGRSEEGSRG